jgi:hypothetical protein
MTYIEWFFVSVVLLAFGIVSHRYRAKIMENLEDERLSTLMLGGWLSGWLIHPRYLNEQGKIYRRKWIFAFVITGFLLASLSFFGP